jgi:hypothetical protein
MKCVNVLPDDVLSDVLGTPCSPYIVGGQG